MLSICCCFGLKKCSFCLPCTTISHKAHCSRLLSPSHPFSLCLLDRSCCYLLVFICERATCVRELREGAFKFSTHYYSMPIHTSLCCRPKFEHKFISSIQRLIEKKCKRIYSFDWLELFGTLTWIHRANVCIFMHTITTEKRTDFSCAKCKFQFFSFVEVNVCVYARTFFFRK